VPGLEEEVNGGNYILSDGKVVGKHEGYPFYTIGQRKGLGIALGYPVFVTEIKKETNEVVLGPIEELGKKGMRVGKLNMLKYSSLQDVHLETVTKVRYKHEGGAAVITQEGEKMIVNFHEYVDAISPGQAAVFYEGDDVVGGGWIEKSF
jgi:tRNA-specific 2-thiouridylase